MGRLDYSVLNQLNADFLRDSRAGESEREIKRTLEKAEESIDSLNIYVWRETWVGRRNLLYLPGVRTELANLLNSAGPSSVSG